MEELQKDLILAELKQMNVLMRVNNILLSKFIMQLQTIRKELHLPKLKSFFKFELTETDYNDLVEEFGRKYTDNALYYLDRQMVQNKMECPNNIKKYLRNFLKKAEIKRRIYETKKKAKSEEGNQ